MTETQTARSSRRQFLKKTGLAAGASVLAGVAVPRVHAAEDNTIRVALVGCGGRGTGAAGNALSVDNGPTRLVAMADVFAGPAGRQPQADSKQRFGDQVDVPEDRRFVGFDAYRKAMDCLRPGDVVIMATPPAFRWVHFGYAIAKGVQRLHGEAGDGRRPHHQRRCSKLADEASAEEPEGGRGAHVASLRGPPGAGRPGPARRNRRS